MLFSVIIPIYNVERYLSKCLDSVLAQTFQDFEVICVNDGSTDNGGELLKDYAEKDNRITIITQQNGGLSAARNSGMKAAKGDYIILLDSDDWIANNTLDVLSKHIDGQDFVAFNGKRVFESGKTEETDEGINEPSTNGWNYFEKYVLKRSNFPFVCAVLRTYRREFLQKHSLSFAEGLYHEDNLFTPLACYYAEMVTSITDVLYFYRIREGSIMTAKNVKRSEDIIAVANKLAVFFEDKKIEQASLNRYIAGLYFRSFMPENKMPEYEKDLTKMIVWDMCKRVCTYPRHKRICAVLHKSPKVFRMYIFFEQLIKSIIR